MSNRNRYNRYKYEKKKTDSIYNIMIYQVFITIAVFIGIYFAALSGNSTVNQLAQDIKDTAAIEFNLPIGDKKGMDYDYDYAATILGVEIEDGKGGFNPFKKIGDARLVFAPAGSSLSPIAVSLPMGVPISGKITSPFGYRINPITKGDDFHKGIDIAAKSGTGIKAPLGGYVIKVGNDKINGNFITIDHGVGLTTTYAHCSMIIAKEGSTVRKGDRIAKVGSTGYSTGPHLHYEIAVKGITYNPSWLYDIN